MKRHVVLSWRLLTTIYWDNDTQLSSNESRRSTKGSAESLLHLSVTMTAFPLFSLFFPRHYLRIRHISSSRDTKSKQIMEPAHKSKLCNHCNPYLQNWHVKKFTSKNMEEKVVTWKEKKQFFIPEQNLLNNSSHPDSDKSTNLYDWKVSQYERKRAQKYTDWILKSYQLS